MSKDIPEIDDLTRGINDSELILMEDTAGTQVEQKEKNNEAQEKDTAVSLSDTGCWDDFMEFLQSDGSGTDKTERLVCNSTVTLRIHLMTAIYMAGAALTW